MVLVGSRVMVLVDGRVMVLVMECKKIVCVVVRRSVMVGVSEYHEEEGNEDAYVVSVVS